MTDLTADYWAAVHGAAQREGWPQVRAAWRRPSDRRRSLANARRAQHGPLALPPTPLPQDKLTKLRQQQILRSLANRSAFNKAALEVVRRGAGVAGGSDRRRQRRRGCRAACRVLSGALPSPQHRCT